jgi:hypothetical protein
VPTLTPRACNAPSKPRTKQPPLPARPSHAPRRCEPGYWCDGETKTPCPAGTYGAQYGLRSPACSGPCAPGHICPHRFDAWTNLIIGSVSPIEHVRTRAGPSWCRTTPLPSVSSISLKRDMPPVGAPFERPLTASVRVLDGATQVCGNASVYCPEGSFVQTRVTTGYYTIGNDGDSLNTTRVGQVLCPVGHYCTGGVLYQCPGWFVSMVERQSPRTFSVYVVGAPVHCDLYGACTCSLRAPFLIYCCWCMLAQVAPSVRPRA